jgi:hypothetical protein
MDWKKAGTSSRRPFSLSAVLKTSVHGGFFAFPNGLN